MRLTHMILRGCAVAALVAAVPASARMKEVRVNAVVTEITHPAGADGVMIGDVATLRARFDDSKLVDVTDAVNAYFGGSAVGIRAASLAAPGSSFTLTFRGDTFTQDVFQGVDLGGYGVANPLLLYLGTEFWGFEVLGARSDGFGVGYFSSAEISLGLPPVFVGGFGCCFGFGQESFKGRIDIEGARISSVPEPSGWALMIAGFGAIGAMVRRRSAFVTVR